MALVFITLLFFLFPFIDFIFVLVGSSSRQFLQLCKEVILAEQTFINLRNTFFLAFSVTFFCLILGLLLAWLIARVNLPYRTQLQGLISLPYAIPPFIGAIAWIQLANPNSGWLNIFFPGLKLNVYGWIGLIWIECTFLYTLVYFNCLKAFENIDPVLEEAAKVSGANSFQIFRYIHLPLLKPHLIVSAFIVFTTTCASFGVPTMIGTPSGIPFLTTQVFNLQKLGTQSGLIKSGIVSLILLFIALVLFFVQKRFNKLQFATVTGKSSRQSLIEFRTTKWFLFLSVLLFLFLVLVMPIMGIVVTSLSKTQGVLSLDNLHFGHFERIIFNTDETLRAFKNSFIVAALAATLSVLMAFMFSYFEKRVFHKTARRVSYIFNLPFSAPGTVVAIVMILAFSKHFFGLPFSIYNTVYMLIIAYFIKYFNFALRPMTESFSQFHASLEEAARISGARWFQVVRRIWLPLLVPQILSAWFIIFIPSLSELTMSILLVGPGTETVGTLIFQLQEYADMSGGGAAVVSVLLLILIFALRFVTEKFVRKS